MMTFGISRIGSWVHRRCRDTEAQWARLVDRLEEEIHRSQRQYNDLQTAYQSLSEQAIVRFKPQDFIHGIFEEVEKPDDKREFLTPSLEEREGIETETP